MGSTGKKYVACIAASAAIVISAPSAAAVGVSGEATGGSASQGALNPAHKVMELDVNRPAPQGASQVTRYWKAGWDNGPRLYMTGSEFWNHSAATIAGIVCTVAASPIAGALCAVGADAAWSGVAPHIAKGGTYYDLSQFMNKGWEKVSADKC